MIWGKRYDHVVIISISSGIQSPDIVHQKDQDDTAGKIRTLLIEQGFGSGVHAQELLNRESLLKTLLTEQPGELTELILNTGMSELEYRRVGQCLEVLREQGVLVICLDDMAGHQGGSRISLHDRHLREMIHGWVQDQQWGSVMSFKGDVPRTAPSVPLDDPTVCLLNAAFSLGGSQFPQRMFGSSMNNAAQRLSGFGWMR